MLVLRALALTASAALLPGSPLVASRSRCTASRAAQTLAALAEAPSTGAVRSNPLSDRFSFLNFHHVELYCADATSSAGRFAHALGMNVVARSDPSTGNTQFCSRVVGSGDIRFVFTAPLPPADPPPPEQARTPATALEFDADYAHAFMQRHGGLAVRAVGVQVADVSTAYEACLQGGGTPVLPPRRLAASAAESVASPSPRAEVAEVQLYGDVVLRLVSLPESFDGAHLPGYASQYDSARPAPAGIGLVQFDHIVGNVWEMVPTIERIKSMTGMHEFAEFSAEDVGTVDSGLNSMVLASNNERVLLPINEPTYGTRRRSQIQTYLEQHGGEGVQHIALHTTDIFATVDAMRAAGARGGFEFMPPPSKAYYEDLPRRIGDGLEAWQLAEAERVGVLVDRDDQGVLVQVFTKPVGDRPTLFLEIIQRIGCQMADETEDPLRPAAALKSLEMIRQRGGCGGFGKGNFKELFKSVEDFERTLDL